MSYDIRLVIDTGGEYPAAVTETISPTYNLAPMFAEALGRRIRDLDGMPAAEVAPLVAAALALMEADPERFRALNPPNGWGSYESAVRALTWLRDACAEHPKATVQV